MNFILLSPLYNIQKLFTSSSFSFALYHFNLLLPQASRLHLCQVAFFPCIIIWWLTELLLFPCRRSQVEWEGSSCDDTESLARQLPDSPIYTTILHLSLVSSSTTIQRESFQLLVLVCGVAVYCSTPAASSI